MLPPMNRIQTIEGFSQDNGHWAHTLQIVDHMNYSWIYTRCLIHQKEPCKDAKAKSVGMMRTLCPSQRDIHLGEILENHIGIQFVGLALSLSHS